jgi:NAD(P)-dependent dehydrogenase (short-subunit alcohol dehydrogenase family)
MADAVDTSLGPAWSLSGRVALVTGAGQGIGRACALELARAGSAVVCVARSRADVDQVAEVIESSGGAALAVAADVTDERQVIEAIGRAEEFGDLRIAVTAAGTSSVGPSVSYPIESWDEQFSVNARGSFLVCRGVGDSLLRRRRPGSIVTLSSQLGTVGYADSAAYVACKHAVEGLTKALGVEWAPHGVRVNAVAPTFVRTRMTAGFLDDPEFSAEIYSRIPAGKLATLDDVARAVRYLASDAASGTTAQILRVDGGYTAI